MLNSTKSLKRIEISLMNVCPNLNIKMSCVTIVLEEYS